MTTASTALVRRLLAAHGVEIVLLDADGAPRCVCGSWQSDTQDGTSSLRVVEVLVEAAAGVRPVPGWLVFLQDGHRATVVEVFPIQDRNDGGTAHEFIAFRVRAHAGVRRT